MNAAMLELPAQPPSPLPVIHAVPELAASGQRAAWYADMKAVLQVPWMGVVTMAYTHYPTFFATLWDGLRPLCASQAYIDAGREIRRTAEDRVAAFGDGEIAQIRRMVEIFSHGNTTYYGLVMMATLPVEGHEIGPRRDPGPPADRHGPDATVPLVLIEPHHADAPTRGIYDDIKDRIGLPFVNTDYRSLARWPSYFARAWDDLRPAVGGATHRAIAVAIHDRARDLAFRLPNPSGLTVEQLQQAASADASLEEVQAMFRLFHFLIPGLIANVAFFRAQLSGS
jgi:hypothetical protein